MTKEEILAMKAGGELDKEVALALGYEVKYWWTIQGKPAYHYRVPSQYGEVWEHLLPYSTDISAAWQVVEKMRSDNTLLYHFGLALSNMSVSQARELGTDYIADLMRWLCPEAICKAALLAKLKG